MKLRGKFNLAIVTALLIGYAGAGLLLHSVIVGYATQAVLVNAQLMMTEANAVQNYVGHQIVPLTGFEQNGKFLTANVPFYAAKSVFKTVRQTFPDYALAEVALNPTNPEDRPEDWQADIINGFRNDPGLQYISRERNSALGAAMELAQPVAVSDASCLACHSSPAAAPASLVRAYGPDNGFGWKLHEIVGAQIVTIPMTLPLAKAAEAFNTFMITLGLVFLVILCLLNLLLHFLVIKPAKHVAAMADAVSLGEPGVPEYQAPGNDEIASLSTSFNRMRRSLDAAFRMLEQR